MSIAELRKEADRLGVPFTNDTTEAELRSMIAARENRPEDLEPLEEGVEIPECFGLMWAANTDEGCKDCRVEKHCLAKMADETIPRLTIEHGRELTPPEIAAELQIPIESIPPALERRAKRFRKSEAKVEPPPAPPAPPVKEESVKKTKSKAKAKAAPKKKPAPVETPEKQEASSDPRPAESVSPVADSAKVPAAESVAPATEQALLRPKSKSGQSGKAKAPPKSAKPKNASSTSSTRSEKAKQMKPGKKAPAKKAAAKSSPKNGQEPWGEHTYQARWERERERCPLIAKVLTPGTKTAREYEGRRYELQVRQGYYLMNGEKYPTLYSTTMAVTGGEKYPVIQKGKQVKGKQRQMSNWSGPKFWKLKSLEA